MLSEVLTPKPQFAMRHLLRAFDRDPEPLLKVPDIRGQKWRSMRNFKKEQMTFSGRPQRVTAAEILAKLQELK